jgi:hypothetical protein
MDLAINEQGVSVPGGFVKRYLFTPWSLFIVCVWELIG